MRPGIIVTILVFGLKLLAGIVASDSFLQSPNLRVSN